jgi:hypothetical protein
VGLAVCLDLWTMTSGAKQSTRTGEVRICMASFQALALLRYPIHSARLHVHGQPLTGTQGAMVASPFAAKMVRNAAVAAINSRGPSCCTWMLTLFRWILLPSNHIKKMYTIAFHIFLPIVLLPPIRSNNYKVLDVVLIERSGLVRLSFSRTVLLQTTV